MQININIRDLFPTPKRVCVCWGGGGHQYILVCVCVGGGGGGMSPLYPTKWRPCQADDIELNSLSDRECINSHDRLTPTRQVDKINPFNLGNWIKVSWKPTVTYALRISIDVSPGNTAFVLSCLVSCRPTVAGCPLRDVMTFDPRTMEQSFRFYWSPHGTESNGSPEFGRPASLNAAFMIRFNRYNTCLCRDGWLPVNW